MILAIASTCRTSSRDCDASRRVITRSRTSRPTGANVVGVDVRLSLPFVAATHTGRHVALIPAASAFTVVEQLGHVVLVDLLRTSRIHYRSYRTDHHRAVVARATRTARSRRAGARTSCVRETPAPSRRRVARAGLQRQSESQSAVPSGTPLVRQPRGATSARSGSLRAPTLRRRQPRCDRANRRPLEGLTRTAKHHGRPGSARPTRAATPTASPTASGRSWATWPRKWATKSSYGRRRGYSRPAPHLKDLLGHPREVLWGAKLGGAYGTRCSGLPRDGERRVHRGGRLGRSRQLHGLLGRQVRSRSKVDAVGPGGRPAAVGPAAAAHPTRIPRDARIAQRRLRDAPGARRGGPLAVGPRR